jgi:hypothetical protein
VSENPEVGIPHDDDTDPNDFAGTDPDGDVGMPAAPEDGT